MIPMAHLLKPSVWAREACGLVPDKWQEEALDCTGQWQAWCCSRQSGKSWCDGVRAMWQAAVKEDQTVLLFSKSLRQSGELFRLVASAYTKMVGGPFREVMPTRTDEASYSLKLTNGSRILSLPGSEESIRGYTPDLVVLDEASRIPDALYKAVRPMLAVSHGTLIVGSTPFGKRGFFWKIWKDRETSEWQTFFTTAADCPRIRSEFLEAEFEALGKDWYEQEYFCRFLEVTGMLFSQEQIDSMFSNNFDVEGLKTVGLDLIVPGRGYQ